MGQRGVRYQFEVLPQAVEGLPPGVGAACIVWERGSRLTITRAAPVDECGSVVFSEIIRQVRGP